jgi:hypothetical protein
MRIIDVVFGECHTILFALFVLVGEKVEWWFTQICADKRRGLPRIGGFGVLDLVLV